MGSSIQALVAHSSDVLAPIAMAIGSRCLDLPQGLTLVPLTEDVMPDDWQDAFEDFSYLPLEIAEAAQQASTGGAIAYLEAETFAGQGIQRAVVWRGGATVWGPRHTCDLEADARGELVWEPSQVDTAVNAALREVGVDRGDDIDEYAALGLHLQRNPRALLD